MNKKHIILFLIAIIFLASCSQVMPQNKTAAPKTTPPSLPKKGSATLIGLVISSKTNAPMKNEIVRLAEVYRQGDSGAYVLDQAFSPGTRTDQNGYFIFENVDAKEYVIIVGDVYDVYKVIAADDGKPRVWDAKPDQILDVDTLKVDLGQ